MGGMEKWVKGVSREWKKRKLKEVKVGKQYEVDVRRGFKGEEDIVGPRSGSDVQRSLRGMERVVQAQVVLEVLGHAGHMFVTPRWAH